MGNLFPDGLAVILLLFFINSFMSDNKQNTGKQDDIRVDSNDPSEVEYLHRKFPDKSHEEIKKAIKEKGPIRKDIIAFLEKS